jgi:DNA repair protein RadC
VNRGLVAGLVVGGVAAAAGVASAVLGRRRSRFADAYMAPLPKMLYRRGLGDDEPVSKKMTCTSVTKGRSIRLCMQRIGEPGRVIRAPGDACEYVHGIGNQDREGFYAIHLNVRNRVIGVEEVSKGSMTGVEVHPREVFKAAILNNAAAMIIAHNHPSSDPTPSVQDIELTRRLVESGKMLGISVLDHVIVTDRGCRSLENEVSFRGARRRGRR